MDQGQGEADRNTGKACRSPPRRGADDDEEEKEGHHDLDNKAAAEAVLTGAEIAVPIGSETTHDPAGFAGRNPPQYQGSDYRADDLGDYVRNDVSGRAAPRTPQTNRHGRVEVATRNVTHGISHGQHSQPEREGNAEKPDPKVRKTCSQNCGTAAAQY